MVLVCCWIKLTFTVDNHRYAIKKKMKWAHVLKDSYHVFKQSRSCWTRVIHLCPAEQYLPPSLEDATVVAIYHALYRLYTLKTHYIYIYIYILYIYNYIYIYTNKIDNAAATASCLISLTPYLSATFPTGITLPSHCKHGPDFFFAAHVDHPRSGLFPTP